ncbi:DUF5723 family protein [Capnocytophaga canimorsus]|uniref:DUF5723 family protein n=1 Tax=Capnocytophaga canimorsus TaxID=28188 RepID=UPI00385A8A99
MKKIFIALTALFSVGVSAQQPFSGIRSSSYLGVQSTLSNPANIVASSKKWDVNLLSFQVNFANNATDLKLSSVKDDLFKLENDKISGVINADVLGPSFMVGGSKFAFALTSRARVFAHLNNLNTHLFKALSENKLTENYVLQSPENQGVTANGWSEIGGTFSMVLFQDLNHVIKAGVTAKLLQGFTSSYVQINGLKDAKIEVDGNELYLTNANAGVVMLNSGVDFTNLKNVSDITKSYGKGIGFDLGLVYERQLESADDWCPNCGIGRGYRYKIGVSLLDIGGIKYSSNPQNSFQYLLNVPAGKRFRLDNLGDNLTQIQENLKKSEYVKTGGISDSYKASLPTSLNLIFDYYAGSRFFVEFASQFNLVSKEDSAKNAYYANSYSLTPRFEGKYFGFYLPLNYSDLSKFNAGVALRMGPLFVGSGSALSVLTNKSKQADVYFGLRFGL